jgi:soluble lytic murein transglycosylase-like protein
MAGLSRQTTGRPASAAREARPLAAKPANPGRAFGQTLAESLAARQSQPRTLADRRQEFPNTRALQAVSSARLSGMLLHSVLGRSLGRGQSRSVTASQERSSPQGEVERHFKAGASLGGRSGGDASAYDNLIKQASQRYQVPEGLIKAVIKVESNFNPRATSPVGAMGLMQLMPGTARDLGVRCAYNPGDNIDGGTRFLKDLLDRYEGNVPMALAAYNWGPGNLDKGRSLPRETRNYLESVGRLYPFRQAAQRLTRKIEPASSHPAPANPRDNLQAPREDKGSLPNIPPRDNSSLST